MHFVFGALQAIFSVWMLIDAVRSRQMIYWWIIILMPFGEFAYFLMIYLPKQGIRPLDSLKQLSKTVVVIPLDVAEAELVARDIPSPENKLKLALAYVDNKRHGEALPLLEAYVRRHPTELSPRFQLAACLVIVDRASDAVVHLEKVVRSDRNWNNFEAAFELARTYNMLERSDDAGALLSKLARGSQRLAPTIALAEHLAAEGQTGAAISELQKGIEVFNRSADFIRKIDYHEAKRAKKLIKSLK